ncbi:protein serine/threonine phosphatase 2C [Penicillium hispanicum]|uniref:protein serine/threonine phosphatase 2C n=1 Tax=Penicillium hispanicum TaxID=1080232 RepID=UPI00253FA5F5|nr:protein serine/threonine phosphatase 2C [Penicillium hispanicum]KAJ5585320.1 protein serine/threonine phosphatase 2C [Penicillium hispanicum]
MVPVHVKSLQHPTVGRQTPALSAEEATNRLRANETSYRISGLNIGRYDQTNLPSNGVMEDAQSEAVVEMPDGRILGFWGIHDGHMITKDPLSLPAVHLLKEAFTEACALLSVYDSQSRVLHVATTGDSRAVLGRRSDQATWTATVLSLDQYGSNPGEQARIRSQHPGEPDVLKNGRLLGSLEPTRAFGDLFYKWTDGMQSQIRSLFVNDNNLERQTAPNATLHDNWTRTSLIYWLRMCVGDHEVCGVTV